MTAYVIFNYLEIFDEQKVLEYRKRAHPTVEEFGGLVVIRPGALQVMEGQSTEYLIATQWDSMEAALRWYNSPQYQSAHKLREDAARVQVIIAEGTVPDA